MQVIIYIYFPFLSLAKNESLFTRGGSYRAVGMAPSYCQPKSMVDVNMKEKAWLMSRSPSQTRDLLARRDTYKGMASFTQSGEPRVLRRAGAIGWKGANKRRDYVTMATLATPWTDSSD